jgi:hypothetical protein
MTLPRPFPVLTSETRQPIYSDDDVALSTNSRNLTSPKLPSYQSPYSVLQFTAIPPSLRSGQERLAGKCTGARL